MQRMRLEDGNWTMVAQAGVDSFGTFGGVEDVFF